MAFHQTIYQRVSSFSVGIWPFDVEFLCIFVGKQVWQRIYDK